MVVKKNIIEDMIEATQDQARMKTVKDIRIGLCYTAVLLDDEQLGLAYTFHTNNAPPCSKPFESGKIKGKNAKEVARYASSDNLLESSLGMAAINAMVNQRVDNTIEGDILDVMTLKNSDTVGMVGFFGPLIEPLKKSAKRIYIFEKKDMSNFSDLYPAEKAPEMLPECDVVIISATTLINKTMGSLLSTSRDARETIILGATTPFLPNVFNKRGVTMLSGIQVADARMLLQIVSEGGGMRDFKGYIKKISLMLKMN